MYRIIPHLTRLCTHVRSRSVDGASACCQLRARHGLSDLQSYMALREAHYLSTLRYSDDFDTKQIETLETKASSQPPASPPATFELRFCVRVCGSVIDGSVMSGVFSCAPS